MTYVLFFSYFSSLLQPPLQKSRYLNCWCPFSRNILWWTMKSQKLWKNIFFICLLITAIVKVTYNLGKIRKKHCLPWFRLEMAVSKYWLILEMVVPRMELKVPSKTMQNYLQMWQVFQSHAMAIKKLNWFQGTFRQSSPFAVLFLLNMWRPISISINFTT